MAGSFLGARVCSLERSGNTAEEEAATALRPNLTDKGSCPGEQGWTLELVSRNLCQASGSMSGKVSGVSAIRLEAFALTNHEASFSAVNAQRLSDILPFPSQDSPVARYVSQNKLSAQGMSDTVRVYENQIGRVSGASFSCLAPNTCQARSRGHGGSHEIHKILTDATKELGNSGNPGHMRCTHAYLCV